MNNFELDQAARDMAAGKTQYQLAKELLLEREKNKVRRVDSADLDRFREAANEATPPASTVMFEMIEIIEGMENQEPVAWRKEIVTSDGVHVRSLFGDNYALFSGAHGVQALFLRPSTPPRRDADFQLGEEHEI